MKYPVTLTDIQNQEIVFSGMAEVEPIPNGYSVKMETTDFSGLWNVYKKGCIIENHAEADVRLVLKSGSGGSARVSTEHGAFSIPAVLDRLESSPDRAEIRYRLGDEREVFHFVLEIER